MPSLQCCAFWPLLVVGNRPLPQRVALPPRSHDAVEAGAR
jgi:hypothetical protein